MSQLPKRAVVICTVKILMEEIKKRTESLVLDALGLAGKPHALIAAYGSNVFLILRC